MKKIAVMLNTLDPFFFSERDLRDCVFPAQEGTQLIQMGIKKFGDKVIQYRGAEPYPELEEALEHTDLGERMSQVGVTHIVMPHRASEKVHTWAQAHAIAVIAPPFALQRDLEHKIWFDDALRKRGIATPRTVAKENAAVEKGPLVAQESTSYGLYGTRFFKDGKSLVNDDMFSTDDILIRAYEEGMPVGISMLIDKSGNYCYSALRRQCFIYDNGFPSQFTGVQWIPFSFLNPKTVAAVEKTMDQLRLFLSDIGFKGLANFDLLLTPGVCKVLECNPRLSSATAHLFASHGLMPIDNAWEFFVNACTDSSNQTIHDGSLPRSEYAGALLDVDIQGTAQLKALPKVGPYKGMFIFHELFPGTASITEDTLCTILSDTIIFDLESGSFNKAGESTYNYFHETYTE